MGHFSTISGRLLALTVLLASAAIPAHAEAPSASATALAPLPVRMLGKSDAPIKVDEFVSLTCPHCAEFYNDTMPEIEKRYIDTGKVRFVFHDFVLDGVGLRAAQLARCMPEDEFFPFIKMIYQHQSEWAASQTPEKILVSYARLGGLSEDKANACLADTNLQNQIVTERDEAAQKYGVDATPAFVINDGAQTIKGSAPIDNFAKVFDPLLAAKH